MNHDRRQHPRYIPDSALLVSLGQSKRGFLKDVSESGMAFDGLLPSPGNNVVYLAFDLPDGGGAIEAVAEVVWTCESLHRTGVRFLELAEASRQQLREWISSHVFALSEKASEEEENPANNLPYVPSAVPFATVSPSVRDLTPSQPVSEATGSVREHEEAQPGVWAARKIIRVPHAPVSVGIILAVLFLSTACVSLGYYLPGIILGRGAGRGIGRASAPLSVAPTASLASNPPGASIAVNHLLVNRSAATKPAVNEVHEVVNQAVAVSKASASAGFILQVGAMAQAVNAAKLIEKLRRKNFPAFLPDRGGDTLYRVEVGPYENIDYARTVEGDLRSAGFPVVLKNRSAQPDSN